MTAAFLLSFLLLGSGAVEHHQYAVVVANNLSLDEGVKPLRYADDDAARWAELLGPLSQRVALLTVFDQETAALHPDLVKRTVPPTLEAVTAALELVAKEVAQDRAHGIETSFFFVFVGHGNVGANREGYVSLLDQRFTRSDLFEKVVKPVGADFVHVVIDACNAYLMVNRRGSEPEVGPAFGELVRGYLGEQDLERFPQLGVVLSTAGERESHEWAGYRAGVFSHEVRSALSGAADVNGDGRIEYSELKAFVAAANLKVDDPRARPEVWARPPSRDRSRPLVDLAAKGFEHFLLFPAGLAGRFHVEDARGIRFADFHKAKDRTVAMALPDQPVYYVRTDESEVRLTIDRRGFLDVSTSTWRTSPLASRGSIEQAFQGALFAEPFGPAFYRGFVATSGDLPVPEPLKPASDP